MFHRMTRFCSDWCVRNWINKFSHKGIAFTHVLSSLLHSVFRSVRPDCPPHNLPANERGCCWNTQHITTTTVRLPKQNQRTNVEKQHFKKEAPLLVGCADSIKDSFNYIHLASASLSGAGHAACCMVLQRDAEHIVHLNEETMAGPIHQHLLVYEENVSHPVAFCPFFPGFRF